MARTSRKGHSPYTTLAISYVESHPGCSKWDLASYLTHHPQRCPSKQYYLVNTQIRLGNLIARHKGNRYELYTPVQIAEQQEAEYAARAAAAGLDASVPDFALRDAEQDAGLVSVA